MIQPIGQNILIKPNSPELKTESGFIIPESQQGRVLLVGTVEGVGNKCDELIQRGDEVAYAQFSGYEMGGFILINQADILGKVTKDEHN